MKKYVADSIATFKQALDLMVTGDMVVLTLNGSDQELKLVNRELADFELLEAGHAAAITRRPRSR